MDAPVYTEPFDPELARTINLTAVFRNTTCLNISWFIPRNLTYIITGLKLGYSSADRINPETTVDIAVMMRYQVICGLSPTTTYTVSLTVQTINGVLIRTARNCSTVQPNPPYPFSPILVNSSYTNITLIISPVKLYDTSTTTVEYFLIDEEVSAPSVTSRAVTTHTISGNITARLTTRHLPDNVYFVVGNGRNYGGYNNVPLQSHSYYVIYYGVCSTFANYTKCSYSAPIGPVYTVPKVYRISSVDGNDEVDHSAGIIVGCILILLLVCSGIFFVVFVRRRMGGAIAVFTYIRQVKRHNAHVVYKCEKDVNQSARESVSEVDYNIEEFWSAAQNYHEGRYITFSTCELPSLSHGHNNLIDSPELRSKALTFADEFHYLKSKKDGVTQNVAKTYPHLNRFPHLLPYDHSLVRLKQDISEDNEYINASFIPGYRKIPGYIAAQSPFNERTVLDFWRLIYQRFIKIVVMMTNLEEKGVIKCLQYWPTSPTDRCGHFNLHVTQITEYAHFTRIDIELSIDEHKNVRNVQIFQMTSWPERGVPDDPLTLLEMRHEIKRHHGDDRTPILVHCGTGVGRTGVFIAVDTLIEQYETEGSVQVCDFIRRMRQDRPYMVRTFSEYVFIYDALFQHFVCGSTSLKTTDIDEKLSLWLDTDMSTGHSYLQDQFTSLRIFTRKNMKNRNPMTGIKFLYKFQDNSDLILTCQSEDENEPSDVTGSFTSERSQDHSSTQPMVQIQADSVEHFQLPHKVVAGRLKSGDHFIVNPFKTEQFIDVIRFISVTNITTIICLSENPLFRGQGNVDFGQGCTFQVLREVTRKNFTFTDVNIIWTKTKHIRVFQKILPSNEQSSVTMTASLVADVIDWQKCNETEPNKVIVLGSLDILSPDLLVIILIICMKVSADHEVDVYKIIKSYNRLYALVNDQNDFKFCYMVLKDFIDLQTDSTI